MKFVKMFHAYKVGMSYLPETSWSAVVDEWEELVEDLSYEECMDVIHAFLRWCKAPSFICFCMGYSTAVKHAKRFVDYGCVRSLRNHRRDGENCSCKKGG